ncbi:MAG TPA: cation-efflux pump [Xanthobacteraceae bacterium]|jgi:cation diffusion facilitator family transporter|nr:cation-efflux pump [Xanthobacteraceae bacterium]
MRRISLRCIDAHDHDRYVATQRHEMWDVKQKVALSSIAASASLTVAKAVAGVMSGSLGLLSEAAHSLIDLGATVMTYFAVRLSGKPADAEHHYGHGKVESVTALAETALLFGLAGVVIWEAAKRLMSAEPPEVEATPWAFAVIVLSIVVDFWRARALHRTAKETSSQALEADALHFSSDMWSSLAVLVGLFGIVLGFASADSVAAVAVSILICIAGWRLGRRTIDALTDTAPPGVADKITAAINHVPGVVAIERLRVRQVGEVAFVDLVVAVSRTLPLDRLAAVKQRIVEAVRADSPAAEVTVTTEPRALDDESVLERVMVIARNRSLAVHHVTAHAIEGRLAVSLDLEVDGALSLGGAHDVATGLEEAIREELGPGVEVETHIEPLQPFDEPGRDASAQRIAAVREALTEIATKVDFVGAIHDVRVRAAGDGEIVNFHCLVDPALKVADVHDKVDEVERALRLRFPSIKRAVGHAEPAPPASP